MNTSMNSESPALLPQGWFRVTVSEVADLIRGVTYDKESSSKEPLRDHVPILRAHNINGEVNYDNLVYVNRTFVSSDQMIKDGDILICMSSGSKDLVGKAAQAKSDLDYAFGAFCSIVRPLASVESRFLGYYFQGETYRRRLAGLSSGVNINNLRREHVEEIALPLAPLCEQQRIAARIDELFSELNAGVASLTRAKALLKKYRQAMLKAAVTGELTRDWRARHQGEIKESGAELLQRILKARRAAWEAAELKKLRAKGKPPKDDRWKQKYKEPQPTDTTALPSLPEGWVWISLDQLLTGIEAGKNFRCEERPPTGHEVGVVKVSAVTWGIFNENESKTITESRLVDRRYTIRAGDFLFSRANTIELVGACVIAGEFRRNLLLSDKILRLRFAHDLGRWVDICLKSQLGRSQIEALATGNQLSMRNISQPSIRRLAIPLPPLKEAEIAVDALEAEQSKANDASVLIDQSSRRSEALRQAILKAAFAGTLVPQDPNDEPASVLLERIRAECAARPKPARGRQPKSVTSRQMELLS